MKEAGDSTAVSVPTAVRREGGGEVVYRTTSQCRGGVVLVISSTAAIVCSAATPVYSATKAALIAFIRSWAVSALFNSVGLMLGLRRSRWRQPCYNTLFILTISRLLQRDVK